MGWEAWGCDLSQDGKYAVYVTDTKGKPPLGQQPEELKPGDIGLLDAQTGIPLWIKQLTVENFPGMVTYIDSKEVAFSHDTTYIGMGTGYGDFCLIERATGNVRDTSLRGKCAESCSAGTTDSCILEAATAGYTSLMQRTVRYNGKLSGPGLTPTGLRFRLTRV